MLRSETATRMDRPAYQASVPAVVRAVKALEHLASAQQPLSLSALARTLEVGPSSLLAILTTLRSAGLLLANFVVAGSIISVGIAVTTRYTVVVHNASDQRLDDVRVFGGGCDAAYGSLLPGATASRSFWIRQDGRLVFRASSGGDAL